MMVILRLMKSHTKRGEVEAVDIADAEAIPTIPLERRFPEMPSWKSFLSV
jgi:hypothetical protein